MPVIESRTFAGARPGPRLLLLGAVHGDERCGTAALAHLMFELQCGIVTLQAGTLTLAPICNPAAYRAGRRFVTHNLNRIVARYAAPADEEGACADALARLIEAADIVVDLHSYHAGSVPFLFMDRADATDAALARAQGLPYWVTGWNEAYSRDGPDAAPDDGPTDSIHYAHRLGKHGFLIECGRHDDPASVDTAYRCARRTLTQLGMAAPFEDIPALPHKTIRLDRIVRHDRPGRFARPWKNFDRVAEGEALIVYEDGDVFAAYDDLTVMLPNESAAPGHEWLYLGKLQDKS